MGGNLSLVAEFSDRDPVVMSGIAEVELSEKLVSAGYPLTGEHEENIGNNGRSFRAFARLGTKIFL
jgi:hypothetical protein